MERKGARVQVAGMELVQAKEIAEGQVSQDDEEERVASCYEVSSSHTTIGSQCGSDCRAWKRESPSDDSSKISFKRFKESKSLDRVVGAEALQMKTSTHKKDCRGGLDGEEPQQLFVSDALSKYLDVESLLVGPAPSHLTRHSDKGGESCKDSNPCSTSNNKEDYTKDHLIQEDYAMDSTDCHDGLSRDLKEGSFFESPLLADSVAPHYVGAMCQSCRDISDFERLGRINEGTYGVVYKARDKKTGEIVAIKKVKMEHLKEGFPITSLREIHILLAFDHPSIVVVKEVAVDKNLDNIYMVMEFSEHDLAGLLKTHKRPFSQSEVKYLMLQLLEGVEYAHVNWVLHRDLKPSNLLLDKQGKLKICDFGLAREYGSPLQTYTSMVVSLWYRAPELLLGLGKYSTAVDMWSVGCIMAELLGQAPLFDSDSELDQLKKIVKVLGNPGESFCQAAISGARWNILKCSTRSKLRDKFPPTSFTGKTALSEIGYNLLSSLLMYDPNKRINAQDAVRHPWFAEDPLPKPLCGSN